VLLTVPVVAQPTVQLRIDSPEIVIDGTVKPFDEYGSAPTIVDGRALVPLRPMIEAVGGTVLWDDDLRLITIRDYFGENEIILKINSYDSVVNARTGPKLDVTPVLVNDVTMVPIMFVAVHLGIDIEWEEDTRTITLMPPNLAR